MITGPNAGLPGPVNGRRYLIVESIGSPGDTTTAWGNLIANANDIIEYSSGAWSVAFDSSNLSDIQYVTNLSTNVQYRYTEGIWMKSWEGWYGQGDYSIVI